MATEKKRGSGTAVLTDTRTEKKVKRPAMYKVLLHNDDFTPMEFVVLVLISIFNKNEAEATTLMLHVHTKGIGVAGIFTRDIAETKVVQTTSAAEKAAYPLLCTMEPAQDEE